MTLRPMRVWLGINLDTEWHANQKGYLDGTAANWYSGVFDWDRSLYPSPPDMMDWLELRGLWPAWMVSTTTLTALLPTLCSVPALPPETLVAVGCTQDVHQKSGVNPANSRFAAFAETMGISPNHKGLVLPDMGNQTFVKAFFELLNGQVGGRNYCASRTPLLQHTYC